MATGEVIRDRQRAVSHRPNYSLDADCHMSGVRSFGRVREPSGE